MAFPDAHCMLIPVHFLSKYIFEGTLFFFGPNYTTYRSVGKTHSPPEGCWAAAVGEVFHTLSCRSYFYVKTEHSSVPVKDQKQNKTYRIITHKHIN